LGRLYILAAILAADCALLASIPHAAPLLGPLAPFGIVSFAVFLGLGHARLRTQTELIEFNFGLFCAHVVCVGALVLANLAAERNAASWFNSQGGLLCAGTVLVVAVGLLALACVPPHAWVSAVRAASPAGQYALIAGAAAWFLRSPFQELWIQSSAANVYLLQSVTFRCVQAVLRFLLPDLVVDAGPFVIGTPQFSVSVGAPCSGIEGLGLVLVFTTVWLWFFRKENRFPQALLLVPCALACAFALNVVRIAALILIGNAGAPEVAFVGFHSQAGWIAFTLVALGFSVATQRLGWVRKVAGGGVLQPSVAATGGGAVRAGEEPEATGAYLIPFLAIMGASFVSKSASGYFEWLYPLRFVAAAIALWIFRREYRSLNWRFGWAAPATGAGIFLVWIAPEFWSHGQAASPLSTALEALSPAARVTWIAFRATAAVVTVPLAEELAFRGYLARRLVARQFDEVPFGQLTLVSIAGSSLVFGLMHGHQWLLGMMAGLAYALLLRRRHRMGDAVMAHAVSNLLLAAWVLARGDWGLW
jgi:exosortase E/protease (VPEID-CTERM system)